MNRSYLNIEMLETINLNIKNTDKSTDDEENITEKEISNNWNKILNKRKMYFTQINLPTGAFKILAKISYKINSKNKI